MSSRFEFLGNTSLGEYIPRDSWFHMRDPRARLLAFVLLFSAAIFTGNIWGLLIGFLAVTAIFLISNLPIRSTWKGIKKALPFIIIIAIIQILFSSPTQADRLLFELWGISVSYQAAIDAGLLVFRFIILIMLLNALVMSISTSQVTSGLFYLLKPFEKIGFPVNDLTMVAQITLRYIPLVAEMAEKTAKAQAARGGDWEQRGFNPIRQAKRVLPLIVPILVNSLKRAETMALAMESRGFNAAETRSSLHRMNFTWEDWILLFAALAISALMIVVCVIC